MDGRHTQGVSANRSGQSQPIATFVAIVAAGILAMGYLLNAIL
jgi:hypothetical protein